MCKNLNNQFPCHPLPFEKYFRIQNCLLELKTQKQKREARNNLGLQIVDLYDYVGINIPNNAFYYSFNKNPIAIFQAKLNPSEFDLNKPVTFLIIYTGSYNDKSFYIWQKDGTWVGKYSETEAPLSLKKFFSENIIDLNAIDLKDFLEEGSILPLNRYYVYKNNPIIGIQAELLKTDFNPSAPSGQLIDCIVFNISTKQKNGICYPEYIAYDSNTGLLKGKWMDMEPTPEDVEKIFKIIQEFATEDDIRNIFEKLKN